MELKETAGKIRELFGCQDGESFHDSVWRVLKSNDRDLIFEKFEELTGGLNEDYLQKIHQFWYADRAEKKQDYTPRSLADLVASLTGHTGSYSVYDFCAGTGAMTLGHWRQNKNISVLCEELDARNIPLLLFNLAIRNICGHVVQMNVLTRQKLSAWRLSPREKFACIEKCEPPQEKFYDAVISNPPFNMPWEPVVDERVPAGLEEAILKSGSNANAAFLFHALHYLDKNGGKAALIFPNNIATGAGAEQAARKYLTKAQQVCAVIRCPAAMFESTSVGTHICCLCGGDAAPAVFVDAREECVQEIRDQRGEGTPSHTNRIYHKQLNVFSDANIERITQAVKNRTIEARFSGCATVEKIEQSDYSFATNQYIEYPNAAAPHRPYKDIAADLVRVIEERNKVKITMNESVAKRFGLYDLGQQVNASNELTDHINETSGKLLGFKLPKSDYFRLSKNASEIKIENKSKTEISSLFMIMVPMYKQHLFYMNECENRLLTELRNALIPDLMNGKIDLGQQGNP